MIDRRLEKLEDKIDKIQEKNEQQSIAEARMMQEIESLKQEFMNLKSDVIAIIQDTTEKTWKLINVFSKVIIALVTIIVGIAGFKLFSTFPDIFAQFIK